VTKLVQRLSKRVAGPNRLVKPHVSALEVTPTTRPTSGV
jgi:hypothetical protein